uniref:EGF-like domain-containing protein n=1 Tax=Anopheles farauti TaxID=69004 RepID=A0A182QRH4_9DIPT
MFLFVCATESSVVCVGFLSVVFVLVCRKTRLLLLSLVADMKRLATLLLLVTHFSAGFASLEKRSAAKACAAHEFQCDNGACIPAAEHCNDRQDCTDGSDETGCDYFLCKAPFWYRCKHENSCISGSSRCDKQIDCFGGDDEENCENYQVPHKAPLCSEAEFTCTDKSCIPSDFVCDGKEHCLDGSDETIGCIDIENKCKGFLCRNKHCLPTSSWVCDGMDDCGDRSDEEHCVHECTLEHGKFECHNNHTCIDVAQVCNGADDCGDGSDEGPNCTTSATACKTLQCGVQPCKVMPDGKAVCLCGLGFKFDVGTGRCQDVNECERYGLCSQGCINTPGSFQCTCIDQFQLTRDRRTCELSTGTEALMLYTTQKSVGAVYLTSMHQYYIAKDLPQVIGVAYDGKHVYWTDIMQKMEMIERAFEDGSGRVQLLTAGLISPEDLTLDWLTGNIYFSDSGQMHIAVCTSDGYHCKPIIEDQLHKPRGLALLPQNGTIFFSDWGKNAMIGRARMDGSDQTVVISNGIHWPNGLTLDWPNGRLYWVDAKLKRIESVRYDGSDRVVVLSDVLKHPFSIAVFNDRIFWTDWSTKSIQSCDKFTGKERRTLVHDRMIFDVHVYHSSVQPKVKHACENHTCTHLCLLTSNVTYACACPQDMELHRDKHSCVEVKKRQRLLLGVGNFLVTQKHHPFGRHEIGKGEPLPGDVQIHRLAFNSLNGEVFVADNAQKAIYTVNLESMRTKLVVRGDIGMISALAFDYLSNTLYWSDAARSTIEIYSLQTHHRSIIQHFLGDDAPIALAVIPEIGKMFIALRSTTGQRRHTHIDRLDMTGRGVHAHVIEERLSANGTISFAVDRDLRAVFWSDAATNRIEMTSYEGDTRHLYREYLREPASLTLIGNELFWTCFQSQRLYWSDKHNTGTTKMVYLQLPPQLSLPPDVIPLVATQPTQHRDHPCLRQNGGCSHICVSAGENAGACVCPTGMVFNSSHSRTCIDAAACEFRCESGECLPKKLRCDGHANCKDASDEQNCEPERVMIVASCKWNEFRCADGSKCIGVERRCDKTPDCSDRSDETDCDQYRRGSNCTRYQFACANGLCVDATARCDGVRDCTDGSDEAGCTQRSSKDEQATTCAAGMFRCNSGQCIPGSWECDGSPDCADASDEHASCRTRASDECGEGYVRCALGFCIAQSLLCDGNDDCGDGSDEEHCQETGAVEGQCQAGDYTNATIFHCTKSNTCLVASVRCNGTAECPHGEDEANCTNCGLHEFQCHDGKCIRSEWRCDQEKDCDDGSDELNCTSGTARVPDTVVNPPVHCGADTFECKTGECVKLEKVCDGQRDCSNGHDEDGNCASACFGGLGPCAHLCQKTPSGSVCSCREGYELAGDRKNCVDMNECEGENPCAQICTNIAGSYRCACHEGFMLRPDKMTCKAMGSVPYVLYTQFDQIRKLTIHPPQIETVIRANGSRITSMDVDVRRAKVYFASENGATLYEHDLSKNQTVALLSNVGTPEKITVDWITSNVYFIDAAEPSIKVCNFEHAACARVVSFTHRNFVKALTIDPVNRQMFYSLLYSWIFQVPHSIIFRAQLDGTLQAVVLKRSGLVSALAVDPQQQMLYFVEVGGNALCRTNYLGQNVTVLVRDQPHVLNNPIHLSVYEDQALIINRASARSTSPIGQCQLFGAHKCDRFNVNVPPTKQLVVVQESRQPTAINVCDRKFIHCTHLCVPHELGGRCICQNGLDIREGDRCPEPKDNSLAVTLLRQGSSDSTPLAVNGNEANAGDGDEGSGFVVRLLNVLLYIVLLIAACGIGFYIYQKRFSSKFDVGIHFNNTQFSTMDVAEVELYKSEGNVLTFQPGQEPSGNHNDSGVPGNLEDCDESDCCNENDEPADSYNDYGNDLRERLIM